MRPNKAAATALLALALGVAMPASLAFAQSGSFAPYLLVDDKAISKYEYDQRVRFMTLLNAPGDVAKEAERSLIEDRLRMAAAQRAKIKIPAERIEEGMVDFASRFELPLDQFIAIIEANGVARETFRDFVHSGIAWRETVRAKFGPNATARIYDAEIDRALSARNQQGMSRVLLSEIVVPTSKRVLINELAKTATSPAAFAAAAREHSVADNAAQGGKADWRDIGTLELGVLQTLNGLQPGQVSKPVRLEDGRYAIYLVHQVQQQPGKPPASATTIDHASLVVGAASDPATAGKIARVRAEVATCSDLGSMPGQFTRKSDLKSTMPAALIAQLEALDENEYAITNQGDATVVTMLCSERIASETAPSREAVRGRLVDARVVGEAELYLQQMRAQAHIRKP